MPDNELDVRELRKPDKHPTISATFGALAVGDSFVLVNNHDPKHLRGEFDAQPDATGAVWRLEARERDLDSNVIALPAGGRIDSHAGPDLDVLIHVLSGDGSLTTETGTVELLPGSLLWLPRRSRRQFTAGPDGLRYLTVHRRRQALVLEPAAKTSARQAV